MPCYEMVCPECDWVAENTCSIADRNTPFACEMCDCAEMKRITSAGRPIGIMPSKPLVLPSIGRTFRTPGELRKYQKDNPHLQMSEGNDSTWTNHKDRAANMADKRAREMGYRDAADRGQTRKRERAREAELTSARK